MLRALSRAALAALSPETEKVNAMTNLDLLNQVIEKFAAINAQAFHAMDGIIPDALVIAPSQHDARLQVLPLELLAEPEIKRAMRTALFTMTVAEARVLQIRTDAPVPDPETIGDNPDARLCLVYLARGRDGTHACGVQYILRPEHGKPTLSALKFLDAETVGIAVDESDNATRH
jgi:hypothetical protein